MRLLFDEQLSEALCDQLRELFPDSVHVRRLAGASLPDERVWALAIEHGCVLVTKDEDFHRDDIRAFDQQHEATFLALG